MKLKKIFLLYICLSFVFFLLFSYREQVESSEEMILIPAGEFTMGNPRGEGNSDEWPAHNVYLDDFYIDRYEVTNREFADFLNSATYSDNWINIKDKRCLIEKKGDFYVPKYGCENHPAIGISWYGASSYAAWAGKRLPTEAEWEKAARGTDRRVFPWGSEWDSLKCANSCPGGIKMLMPGGSFPEGASYYGVMDMAGNVWEWCSDWYDWNYYKKSPAENPAGPVEGNSKVIRGGSWFYSSPSDFRCSRRAGKALTCKLINIGFRCAKDF